MRSKLPSPPYRGGCLCGAVRYSYGARPMGVNACHCQDCKILTGADYVKMLIAAREHFTREQGETDVFRKRADSGREVDIHRCAQCGTRLWHEPLSAPTLLFICAGTLDDSSWAIPASHIWAEKAAPGFVFEGDALIVQGQPAERKTLWDAFDKLYPA
jgi:hypothetical protein